MIRVARLTFLLGLCFCVMGTTLLCAAPYASNTVISGVDVSFILNEPADTLFYRINNGPLQYLDGSTKGTKSFTLNAPGDAFSIVAGKTDAVGYTIPTGGTVPGAANGLFMASDEAGLNLISNDADNLVKFNSPRGLSVSNNPNAPKFGTSYISNSAVGTTAGRTLGDGIYAIHADQSDAFGYVNTAQNPGGLFDAFGASANSPFRVFVAANGEVYVADWSDPNGNVMRLNTDLTSGTRVFSGNANNVVPLPPGQYHGSIPAVHVEGSSATGDLVVYTIDEDLRSSELGGPAGDDRNSLWRYQLDGGALPSNVVPTKVNATNVLTPAAQADLHRGADGKWYLMQTRNGVLNSPTLFVLSADGSTVLFNSLQVTRDLLGNPAADRDILQYSQAMAVSEDQSWLALLLNNSDVAVIPLVNGIPDLANRMVVDSGNIISGRDIAFDAAGNIHYVSSGQALYRVLSPGGTTWAATRYDGNSFSFSIGSNAIPEPAAAMLTVIGFIGALCAIRRR